MNDQYIYSATDADGQPRFERIKSPEEILIDRIVDCWDKRGEIKYRSIYDGWSVDKLQTYLDELEQAPLPEPEPTAPPLPNGHDKAKPKGRAIKTGQGYFVQTPLDACVDPRISHTDHRLLSLLINLSGEKGYCWHSVKWLAEQFPGPAGRKGVCNDTIERSTMRLRRAGYLDVIKPNDLVCRGYNHKTEGNTYVLRLNLRG